MNRRPLIVLDALLVRPRPTGVGRSILELTAALAARDRGLDFAVLATHPEMFDHLAGRPGWRVIPCPKARGGTLRKALFTQLRLPGLVRNLGADLLHCLQFTGPVRPRGPLVVTVHDLGYRHFPATIEQPRLGYYRLVVPRCLAAAAAIVANSEATARDVRETFPTLAERVRTTPFGTPTWVHRCPPAPVERAPDAPFLFVGTLEPRKNLERILAAYERFRADRSAAGRPAPRLLLVGGRGWRDSGLRPRLESLVAAGAVDVEDYCDTDRLWELYGLARALLFPSLHEGFGFPILEAMAANLPVLTADVGAMAEVAGDAALLVDPCETTALVDAMTLLTDDSARRADLVARGRERVKVWDWERTAAATLAVYAQVLALSR